MDIKQPQGNAILVTEKLSQVYKDAEIYRKRYQELAAKFEAIYKQKPQFFSRAPGRVNMIGEHIDYMGYGVFPFALEQDCLMAFSINANSQEIIINHVDYQTYPPQTLKSNPEDKPNFVDNYLKYMWAGYQASLLQSNLNNQATGLNILVSGNVPIAAGLSSSAALVVCSGILALFANNLNNKIESSVLIERFIKYERMLGTACGGMDQTISVLGTAGKALYIQFSPLRTESVQLPTGVAFVICNSLTEAPKLLTLGTRYNKRVCECRIALRILCKKLGIEASVYKEWITLSQLQQYLQKDYDQMVELVKNNIERKPFSLQDVEQQIQGSFEELIKDVPQYEKVIEVNKEFFPFERATHVFGEAGRVIKFREICNKKDMPDNEKATALGDLMNETHYSLRDLFDCSSKELDELTDICRKNGALGSRLTGAGWGGCTVNLVREGDQDKLIQNVIEKYLSKKVDIKTVNISTLIFATTPCNGALILKNTEFL